MIRPIRVDHTIFFYKWLLKLIHSEESLAEGAEVCQTAISTKSRQGSLTVSFPAGSLTQVGRVLTWNVGIIFSEREWVSCSPVWLLVLSNKREICRRIKLDDDGAHIPSCSRTHPSQISRLFIPLSLGIHFPTTPSLWHPPVSDLSLWLRICKHWKFADSQNLSFTNHFWYLSQLRVSIEVDLLIWLSESSFLVWFSEVSLIRNNQGKVTVWLSKILIIKEWKGWLSQKIKVFTTSLPTFPILPTIHRTKQLTE